MKKFISVVLTLAMVMSCFGMTAFAADEATNVWSSSYVTWLSAGNIGGTAVQTPPTADTGFAKPSAVLAEDNTYVGTNNYYQKAALYGAGETTVVYAGTASDTDAKVVLSATNYSHYVGSDKGYTENDRLAFSMYVNLVEGDIGNVYAMRPSAGVEVTQDMMAGYLSSHKGEWVKLDVFIQPKITYTYTRTNNTTGEVEEGLTYSRVNFNNTNQDVANGAVLSSMPGYDAETYTYAVTKVTYGKMSSYINGELVKNEVELTSTSGNGVTYADDNIPNRIAFMVKDIKTKTALYVSNAQIFKVSNFDPATLELTKAPVLADGDKYDIVNKAVALGSTDVTVADIAASGDCIVNVYAAADTTYSTPKASDYVIQDGDKILVRSGALNINYYTAAEAPEVKEFTDEAGNVFTWSFSPYTGILTVDAKTGTGVAMTFADATVTATGGVAACYPWQALSDKYKITDIQIGPGISTIARQAFQGLNGLEEIKLPANVTSWGWGAFNGCGNLKKVEYEYGSKVTGGDKMFAGCSNLSEVILPPTVYAVAGRCFWNCKSLKELMITATHGDLSIADSAFGADNAANGLNITLKYYKGSDAAADVTAVASPANSTVTTQAVEAAGLLPDRSGNKDSIGWEVKDGVARIYDVTNVGNGELPAGNTGHGQRSSLPWCYFGTLDEVIVEEGITRLSQWSMQDIKATTVTLPSTITGSDSYVFNSTNPITNLVFSEGFGATGKGELINRNCNITNIYLPSTATSIANNIYRGLHKDDGNVYTGTSTVNFIAPEDSYAYTWATNMAANVTTDKAVTINVKSESDRLYAYAMGGYVSSVSVGNGAHKPVAGSDGKYDTAYEVYSVTEGQGNAFFSGPSFDRDMFAKRAYTVFEADIKLGENGDYFFFGSDQHRHVGDSIKHDSALVTDGWNKVVTVVDYNTGVSKTYVNGLYVEETQVAALWKDGAVYTSGGKEKTCTSTRFIVYDRNGISETVPALYIDNMAIYATDVNPADSYVAPLTASAYDAATGVTFTASDAVKALDSNIVIAAAYDADDNMVGKVVTGTGAVTIAPVDGATKYVGYVWDSLNGLVPIAASVPVDAQ